MSESHVREDRITKIIGPQRPETGRLEPSEELPSQPEGVRSYEFHVKGQGSGDPEVQG